MATKTTDAQGELSVPILLDLSSRPCAVQLSDILTLQSEMSDAVRLEDYRRAAHIKGRLEELAKQDIVNEVVEVRCLAVCLSVQ